MHEVRTKMFVFLLFFFCFFFFFVFVNVNPIAREGLLSIFGIEPDCFLDDRTYPEVPEIPGEHLNRMS